MATQVIGKAAGTTVRLSNGATTLVYAGVPVPESADKNDVERLVQEGYLEQVDAPEGDGEPKAPAGNAGLEKWVEYAESLGLEVPEGASRDDVKALVAASKE